MVQRTLNANPKLTISQPIYISPKIFLKPIWCTQCKVSPNFDIEITNRGWLMASYKTSTCRNPSSSASKSLDESFPTGFVKRLLSTVRI